jgi:hypothetical protein
MKQPSRNCFILLPGFLFFSFYLLLFNGQAYDKIDFFSRTPFQDRTRTQQDLIISTISRVEETRMQHEQITLPVDKLKAIMDACASHNNRMSMFL